MKTAKFLLTILVMSTLFFGCKKKSDLNKMCGNYSGTFKLINESDKSTYQSNATIKFINSIYKSTLGISGNSGNNGMGDYEFNKNTITFYANGDVAEPQSNRTLLNGKYNFSLKGESLTIWKNYEGFSYEYNLIKK